MSDSAHDDAAQDNAAQDNAAQHNDTATTAAEAEVNDEAAEALEATEPTADMDETKRKFREALDRKHQANTREGGGTSGRGTVKGKGAQGPATSRRSFRRKSG
jgi:hypothetical protein